MEETTLPSTPGSADSPDLAGELRLHELQSRIFRNTRQLRIWLPPGYSAPENQARHYPVFYLNDGQNLFDPATAYIGVDWQADEAADRLIREGRIPPLIIVGIDNAQKDRAREYLPYRSFHPPIMRPLGKRYPDFLLERSNALCLSAVPHRSRPGKYGAGRIVSGGHCFALHRDGPARNFRPLAAGEPVLIYLQPATPEIQLALSGNGRPGSSWRWEPEKREAKIVIRKS